MNRVENPKVRTVYPAEWIVLVFFTYCLARLAWLGSVSFAETNWVNYPRSDMMFSILAVLVLRLVRAFRKAVLVRGVAEPVLVRLTLPAMLGLTLVAMYGFRPEQRAIFGGLLGALDYYVHTARYFFLVALAGAALALGARLQLKLRGVLLPEAFALESLRLLAHEARRWLPLFGLVCFYPLVPLIIRHSEAMPSRDALLATIDAGLFLGHNPLTLLEGVTTPWVSEWMAFCYTSYVYIFLGVLAVLYVRDERMSFNRTCFALTFALAVGYLGYTLVPAQGPVFHQQFKVNLDLYYMREFKEQFIDRTRIEFDCFPSLHTALTLVLLWTAWRHARGLFWALLPVAATIPVACVYLRYHHVIDVLAGIVLAAAVAATAEVVFPEQEMAGP